MIEFVTACDDATNANLTVARPSLSANALVAEGATRARLLRALLDFPDEPLLVWSHGNHDGPKAQDGTPALATDALNDVAARAAWAWACHTGTRFGERMTKLGWSWWGYTGAITAPDTNDAAEIQVLSRAFGAATRSFACATDPTRCVAALVALRTELDSIEFELDDLGTASYVPYSFLHQLWSRARVWFPGVDRPVAHPSAPPPNFLD